MTNVSSTDWHATLDQTPKTIGRSPDADIRIPPGFACVSRRHAEVSADKQRATLRDLGSRSGTKVNGAWIEALRHVNIRGGDRIWLGGVELQVSDQLPSPADMNDESSELSVSHPGESVSMVTAALPSRVLMSSLSPAEMEVVMCICRGVFDDKEIGAELYRSPHTVRTQVGSILRKLKLNARNQIIGFLRNNSEFNHRTNE